MAFCSNCGERVDSTKPFCASCGAKIDENHISRRYQASETKKKPSSMKKIKFKRINWRVYSLIGLILLLAALYFTFDPFNKDVAFAQWGELTEQEKSTLVTNYMVENYPDLTSPAADEIIRYCNLLYDETGGKNQTISSVLSEYVELDKEQRIAIIAKLSGDLIEDNSSNKENSDE